MKDLIDFTKFLEIEKKLEIKIGHILTSEDVPKSKKLLRLVVDFGNNDFRVVVTNIKSDLPDENFLEDKKLPFITNLEPVTIMGIESTAMIMPGDIKNGHLIFGIDAITGTQIL